MTFGFLLCCSFPEALLLQLTLGLLGALAGFVAYAQVAKVFNFWPLHTADKHSETLTTDDLRTIYKRFTEALEPRDLLVSSVKPPTLFSAPTRAHHGVRAIADPAPVVESTSKFGLGKKK